MVPAVRRGAPFFKKAYMMAEIDGVSVWYKQEIENHTKPIVIECEPGFLKCLRIKERRV